MATRVRSYSKINLGLAIGPVRADGFHGLATLYQTLALHDLITIGAHRVGHGSAYPAQATKLTLTTNHPQVPADARNTAWKMVESALARMGIAAEVAIHIEKTLPVQGGLGAGSANAAATLIGLERELGLTLPKHERLELAAEVGSDVPLFLLGGAVLGTGRGELVSAMPDLPATWCVVAVPEVGVSTPRAFQEWDSLCAAKGAGNGERAKAAEGPGPKPPTFEPGYRGLKPAATPGGGDKQQTKGIGDAANAALTSTPQPDRLEELSHVYASVFGVRPATGQTPDTSGIVRGPSSEQQAKGSTPNGLAENALLALVRTGIENDFEQVVFPQYPLLREIKRLLMGTSADGFFDAHPADSSSNAFYAALSGSGSALFGLYRSETDARAAQQRVQATGCKAILTETLPRQQYWRTMFAE